MEGEGSVFFQSCFEKAKKYKDPVSFILKKRVGDLSCSASLSNGKIGTVQNSSLDSSRATFRKAEWLRGPP